MDKVISINESQIKDHLGHLVRDTVEETLNQLLDAEADQLCNAPKYSRSPERTDTRAGHYLRKLHTRAGEVQLKVPKLRKTTFETAITEALWGTRVSPATVSNLNKLKSTGSASIRRLSSILIGDCAQPVIARYPSVNIP